jgi:hypothetical protein
MRATTVAASSLARGPTRFRSALLVLQVALTFTLVVSGGLFARSVHNTRQNLGYHPEALYVVAADLRKTGVRGAVDIRRAFDAMSREIAASPFVARTALSSGSFLGTGGPSLVRPALPDSGKEGFTVVAVSPHYFAAIGSRVVRGRPFAGTDDGSGRSVAIVDELMAREEWPGEDAVGKCGFGTFASECMEVVGVIEARRTSLGSRRVDRTLFIPLAQAAEEQTPQLVVVRAKGSSAAAQSAIATAARAAVPGLPYVSVRSFDELADVQTRSWRLGQTMFGGFAGVGIFLSSLGLYAIVALATRQRTTEIGVRMALGARRIDIARLTLRQARTLVGAGWGLGLAAAFVATRYMEQLLFQVHPTDVQTFAGASLIVLAAGLAGCLVPAVRAAGVSPVKALRHE